MRWRSVAWSWPESSRSHGWRSPASCSATGRVRPALRPWRRFSCRMAAAPASHSRGSCSCSARMPAPARRRRDAAQHSQRDGRRHMTSNNAIEAAKAVVRRNTEEVQGGGNFEVFEELFADDFLDHTPQPGRTPDKAGAREHYRRPRAAVPDFHADIHWQLAHGDPVTSYNTDPLPPQ